MAKADFEWLPLIFDIWNFADYDSVLALLPRPSLFHPVAYNPGGFDRNYPDLLPPNPAWGTLDDFRTMFQEAQAMGHLVMPCTNPTWWDELSPTVRNLAPPLTISDIAVLDRGGQPRIEIYSHNDGMVVCPHQDFVSGRPDSLFQQITVDVPSDFVLEDQVEARPPPSTSTPLPLRLPPTSKAGWPMPGSTRR